MSDDEHNALIERNAALEAKLATALLEKYAAFTDGLEAGAEICASLAETTYDDADAFDAATGCEAAIMRVVNEQRAEQSRAAIDAIKDDAP